MNATAYVSGEWLPFDSYGDGHGLHWYALNYRTAGSPEEAKTAWEALEAYVEGLVERASER